MELDWGDGDYSRTAAVLAPVSEVVVDAAGVARGHRVVDVACGTGNAALVAAGRGATVVGVDLSPGLVERARARAIEAGAADATFVVGDACALPVEPGTFDVAVSVFGVIFAPDPAAAVGRMCAALRPGGVLAIASWIGRGPIHDAASCLRAAFPADEGRARGDWEDPQWVAALLTEAGAREVTQREGELTWEAASAEEWFADQEENHPAWRGMRGLLAPESWERVREESVAALRAGSEDPTCFRARAPYMVTRALREKRPRAIV